MAPVNGIRGPFQEHRRLTARLPDRVVKKCINFKSLTRSATGVFASKSRKVGSDVLGTNFTATAFQHGAFAFSPQAPETEC